jgi:hypothetical protein
MATKQDKNQNRYRTIRSAILTASLLSILPLFVLMKSGVGDASATSNLATSTQGIAVAASPTQTTNRQNAVRQTAATPVTVTASKSSSTNSSSAMTYTRTKAS